MEPLGDMIGLDEEPRKWRAKPPPPADARRNGVAVSGTGLYRLSGLGANTGDATGTMRHQSPRGLVLTVTEAEELARARKRAGL